MEKYDIFDNITCPITGMIFYEPVVASDNITYEKDFIKKWKKMHNTSPITREYLKNSLYSNKIIKDIIDDLIEQNPGLKENQYICYKEYNKYSLEVRKYIDAGKFNELFKYTNFDIEEMNNNNSFIELLENCKDKNIIQYVLDNTKDINFSTIDGWKPIHFVCRYSTPEIIIYMLDLIDLKELESKTFEGLMPIHLLCQFSTIETIEHILNKGINLTRITQKNENILDFISNINNFVDFIKIDVFKLILDYLFCSCQNGINILYDVIKNLSRPNTSFDEIVRYTINISHEYNIDFNSKKNRIFIHYLTKNVLIYNRDINLIKLAIKNGADMTICNSRGWRIIHTACRYSSHNNDGDKLIKYLINQSINLESKTNKYWKPIHFIFRYGKFSTIKFFCKLRIDKYSLAGISSDKNGLNTPIFLINKNKHLSQSQKKYFIDAIQKKKI